MLVLVLLLTACAGVTEMRSADERLLQQGKGLCSSSHTITDQQGMTSVSVTEQGTGVRSIGPLDRDEV
jgi:hypothetical protein